MPLLLLWLDVSINGDDRLWTDLQDDQIELTAIWYQSKDDF